MYTDQQVLQEIQYAMLEPPNLGATWPSGLWTATEVIRYLNQRQNRFLKDTHLHVGIAEITATAGTYQYTLPDDWIATVRVVWINTNHNANDLIRSDTWEADHGIPTWTYTQGTPKIYLDSSSPTLTIRIAPVPDANGTLQVYFIPLAAVLDGSGEVMPLPDEFIPTVKYGTMADMLTKVGRAQDVRAEYCTQRFTLGCEIATMLLHGWSH